MALFDMDVEDMPEFKQLESGEYEAIISKAESGASKAGNPMLTLGLTIQSEDPDINNSKVTYYHMIPQKQNEYYDIQLKSTKAMCEALGLDGNPELDDFNGLECRILVEGPAEEGGFPSVKRFLK